MRIPFTKPAILVLLSILLVSGCNRQRPDSKTLDKQMLEAAANGNAARVSQLLREGASIHAKNANDETVLAIAAHSGNGPLVALLLDQGPNIEEKNQALFSAVELQPTMVVSVTSPESIQRPFVSHPEFTGDYVVNLLLSKGSEVEARDEEGATPLIEAASHGGTNAVKMLLDRRANVNAKDNSGHTALIAAACACAVIDMPDTFEAMILLLNNGAEIDAKTADGQSALMAAAGSGRTNIVKLLLDRGANVHAKDKHGETALSLAKKNNHQDSQGDHDDLVRLLARAMSHPD